MEKFNYTLIVDDDPVCNYMTNYFLRRMGICEEISFSKNGKEALRFLEKNAENLPGLILLDLNMPVMDGFEFLESVTEKCFDRSKTKIVLHTLCSKDIRKEAERYNVEVIDKPLTLEKFYRATQTCSHEQSHGICPP